MSTRDFLKFSDEKYKDDEWGGHKQLIFLARSISHFPHLSWRNNNCVWHFVVTSWAKCLLGVVSTTRNRSLSSANQKPALRPTDQSEAGNCVWWRVECGQVLISVKAWFMTKLLIPALSYYLHFAQIRHDTKSVQNSRRNNSRERRMKSPMLRLGFVLTGQIKRRSRKRLRAEDTLRCDISLVWQVSPHCSWQYWSSSDFSFLKWILRRDRTTVSKVLKTRCADCWVMLGSASHHSHRQS